MFRRSLVAAGEAVSRDPIRSTEDPSESGPASSPPADPPAARSTGPTLPDRSVGADAGLDLTPEQRDVLTLGSTAVLGVNDPVRGPHLTSSIYHWDGRVVRVPSELFAARVASIEQDPRISVLVKSASSDAWLALSGVAAIVSGEGVASEMLTILDKYLSEAEARRLWTEMHATGDPVVIRIRPTRLVWRSDADLPRRSDVS